MHETVRMMPENYASIDAFGHFDNDERTFVLTQDPPAKWFNCHYNQPADDEIYTEVSHLGDGPVRLRDKDGVEVKLTGYDSRHVYLRDESDGTAFSPWGAPAPHAVEAPRCTYHAAYTRIESICSGLAVSQRVFVPKDKPIEITTVSLRNLSDQPKKVSVFAYLLWDLTGRDADGKGFHKDNYTDIVPELGGVLAFNRNRLCPHDRCNGYLVARNGFVAADGYRDYALRLDFSVATPKLLWGEDCKNRPGYGLDCAAMVQAQVEIAPGGSERVDFILGQCRNADEVRKTTANLDATHIDALCEERIAFENARSAYLTVDTGHFNLDALFNHFIKKQVSSYNINKSGFRDNLQNDVSLAMFDYPSARDNLLRALASQFPNGECPHGFRPLNRLKFSDKPAWIFLAVPELLKESGDWSLLETNVPFLDSTESGSVLEHMIRAMRYLAGDTGKHGLCRQHHADWNDGLQATEASGERESVMVTQQLCYGMLEFIELTRRLNREDLAVEARQIHEHFNTVLNEVAWDGQWYIRTICEDGYRIGSSSNKEGRIFLNPQSWAILSGTADSERSRLCMEGVDTFIETDIGYRICQPGFSEYDPRVGKMSNSMPGRAENGGCYNHGAGFKAVADCLLGRAEKAWETLIKVAPDNPGNPVGRSGAAPFSFNNFYSQVPQIYGTSGYAWKTGTGSWFNFALMEFILGARRSYEGLTLRPCLPGSLQQAGLQRTFRGAVYDITYTRDQANADVTIHQDGNLLADSNLKLVDAGSRSEIRVTLPKKEN